MQQSTAKVALTIWNGRMSPVFDVSREALILTLERGTLVERQRANIETPCAEHKVDRLEELGVGTLICGAISAPLHQHLRARGVKVIAFVAGEIEEVVSCFLDGGLPSPQLSMPGCCGRQRRFRGGRGRRGGGGRGRQRRE
ncbi:MAG: NifB/NifX family molybdenum-iron cluster-binding protein [Myxococcota bacterium]